MNDPAQPRLPEPNHLNVLIQREEWPSVIRHLQNPQGHMDVVRPSEDASLPLHAVCQRSPPAAVVVQMIQLHPLATRIQGGGEARLPLHQACAFPSGDQVAAVVECLLEAFPDGARQQSAGGNLPLHLACENGAPADVVRILLNVFPDGTNTVNNIQRRPIHVACTNRANQAVIRELLGENQQSASVVAGDGFLPIHLACTTGASREVVTQLITAYGEGTRARDDSGELPIHSACFWNAPVDVVRTLLSHYPEGASIRTTQGYLPLHAALENGSDEELLREVLRVYPEAIFVTEPQDFTFPRTRENLMDLAFPNGTNVPNALGRLPLHVACAARAPRDLIRSLQNTNPAAVRAADQNGNLPLHIACESAAPVEVIRDLNHFYPAGARQRNSQGQFPLQLALACVERGSNFDIARDLLRVYPEAIFSFAPSESVSRDRLLSEAFPEGRRTPNDRGRLPLHLASATAATRESIRTEYQAHPEAAQMADGNGLLPLHIACDRPDATVDIVRELIGYHRGALEMRDNFGRLPFVIASIRKAPADVMYFLLRENSDFLKALS